MEIEFLFGNFEFCFTITIIISVAMAIVKIFPCYRYTLWEVRFMLMPPCEHGQWHVVSTLYAR